MSNIQDLAMKRAAAKQALDCLGMAAVPFGDPERALAQDARYRLVADAAYKADREYRDAIENLSADELTALAQSS